MARPRNHAAPTSRRFFQRGNNDTALPPLIAELVETDDPAIPYITAQFLGARLAGEDTTSELVIARCVRDGRADWILTADGVA